MITLYIAYVKFTGYWYRIAKEHRRAYLFLKVMLTTAEAAEKTVMDWGTEAETETSAV
jgi:hypothetical protein